MNDYILFMYDDAPDRAAADDPEKWGEYIAVLRRSGQFDGGSSIGAGARLKKGEPAQAASKQITGFVRVRAATLDEAKRFVTGNPVHEAGGTVEVRELTRD